MYYESREDTAFQWHLALLTSIVLLEIIFLEDIWTVFNKEVIFHVIYLVYNATMSYKTQCFVGDTAQIILHSSWFARSFELKGNAQII